MPFSRQQNASHILLCAQVHLDMHSARVCSCVFMCAQSCMQFACACTHTHTSIMCEKHFHCQSFDALALFGLTNERRVQFWQRCFDQNEAKPIHIDKCAPIYLTCWAPCIDVRTNANFPMPGDRCISPESIASSRIVWVCVCTPMCGL